MVNPKRNTHHTQAHITSHHITHAQAQGRKEGTKARTDGGREVNIAIDRGKGKDKEKKKTSILQILHNSNGYLRTTNNATGNRSGNSNIPTNI